MKTPWGIFRLVLTTEGLYSVKFPERADGKKCRSRFSGLVFEKRKLDLTGCTPFQLKVYAALRKVPVGKTVTYGELAMLAGCPGAARAVGTAMKKNRLPVVIPCHRVVPASGELGEYSAGKKWKRLLLENEKR